VSTIPKSRIHKDIRPIGTVIRWITPKFTRQSFLRSVKNAKNFRAARNSAFAENS